jgi:hypothetical protein
LIRHDVDGELIETKAASTSGSVDTDESKDHMKIVATL